MFPLAFPPPVKSPQCLRRLTPNLRLQIQQLSSKHRHIPVLEVWQPSIFNSRVGKHIPKLGSKDVYVSQCEGFLHLGKDGGDSGANGTTKNPKKDGDVNPERSIVSVITSGHHEEDETSQQQQQQQPQQPRSRSDSTGSRFGSRCSIFFADDSSVWEAAVLSPQLYRIGCRDRTLEWEKGHDGLVLRIGDLRRSWVVAGMSRTGIEVYKWKRDVRDYIRGVMGSTDDERVVDRRLCLLVLTSGVWVAGQEGWFN